MVKEKISTLVKPTLGLWGATSERDGTHCTRCIFMDYIPDAGRGYRSQRGIGGKRYLGRDRGGVDCLPCSRRFRTRSWRRFTRRRALPALLTLRRRLSWINAGASKKSGSRFSGAPLAKLATGWAAHLFYWVYPGVMVAMMALTMIGYIYHSILPAETFSAMGP
jgi:hypothetical protein